MAEQLPLQLDIRAEQSFTSFYTGCHHEIVTALTNTANGKGEQQVFIWGENGTGKTHLLQAACQQAHQQKRTAFYLPFQEKRLPSTAILEGLEDFQLVCIDNVEYCATNKKWELALFNFYNQHRENNHKLILSAHCPPRDLALQLTDLKTRMSWGLTLKLHELSDADRIAAFTCKAKYLGLEISPQVGEFIAKHYARDLPTLWSLLTKLEQATLIAKRKLTLPFLKDFLAEQQNDH